MLPALEVLVAGIAAVAFGNVTELTPVDRFEKLSKNARREPHASSLFSSLDNQKIDGKSSVYGACACGQLIHSRFPRTAQ
ncbi:MAG: hypothetical protein ACREDV_01255, partial [Methylocella sp.]